MNVLPKSAAGERRQTVCVCVGLVLAVVAVFGQTAGFGFVNYDDQIYVYENPVVRAGLTWKGALWALAYGKIGHWHPLTWLSHMADCQMFGLWAGGAHLTNVALHAANAVLLFLALRSMTGALWRSAFVAAVFAVHPLRVESVAWISERKDVLSGLFFMLTIAAYVRFTRRPSRGHFVAVALLFALGLLSKNTLVTLPFVLLLLDWWPLGRMKQDPKVQFPALVREKIPQFVLSLASCVATALVPEKLMARARIPFPERVANALVSYAVYLRQTFYPANLAVPYLYPPGGTRLWKVGVALVVLAGVTAAVLALRRRSPYLLVGWLWFWGMLVPMIGLVQISYYSHADRYTYLSAIGLAIAVTWALADWSARWPARREILGSLMVLVIAALMVSARAQTSYWRDNQALWVHALECTINNSIARFSLGAAQADRGLNDEAIAQYRLALQINPDYAEALSNLGIALFHKGQKPEAIAAYRRALEINPDYAEAHDNLGVALFAGGAQEEAIAEYHRAIQIDPDDAEARSNLGIALFSAGQKDEAVAQYRKALEIDPGYVKAHYNWGNALAAEGHLDEAIAHFRKALQIKPGYAPACTSLGLVYFQKGDFKDAIDSWQRSLEIKPEQPGVENNLAWLLATSPDSTLRNGAKAVTLAEDASKLNGDANPIVLHTLAAAYAENGRYRDAAATARRALELAQAQQNGDLTARLPEEIKLYEAGAPVRDAPR